MFARLFSDVRLALRLLRRNPGFAVTVLGVLALGLGATTAMFSLVSSLFFAPLPYPHAEELMTVYESRPWNGPVSLPDFTDWHAGQTTFAHLAAVRGTTLNVRGGAASEPESVSGVQVTGEFFATIGVAPQRGRFFDTKEDVVGGPKVAVVSAALWHRQFSSDPNLVGQAISINGQQFTVVAIGPENFQFGSGFDSRVDVWMPLASGMVASEYAEVSRQRGSHFLWVLGRLAPGVTQQAAQAQMSSIAAGLTAAHPDNNTNVGAKVMDLRTVLLGGSNTSGTDTVWMLFAAVGLVFVVVCANVANLLLARAASRRSEMALRVALGATAAHVRKQIVVETMTVFVLGSAGGLALASWLVHYFAGGLAWSNARRVMTIGLDWRAFAFAVLLALGAGLVSGLLPASLAARVAPQAALAAGAARASGGRSQRTLRGGLIVAQVAIAFALLFGVGMAVRSFMAKVAEPVGFDDRDLTAAKIALPAEKYGTDDAAIASFYDRVLEKVAAQPGVTAVAAARSIPVEPAYSNGGFEIEGKPSFPPGSDIRLEFDIASPGYFKMVGIPVLRGREFTREDTKNGRLVMVISKAAADRFFPNEDPIGHRIELGGHADGQPPLWREIVGIVANVPQKRWNDEIDESYVPIAQSTTMPAYYMHIFARTKLGAELRKEIPAIVASVDPNQAVSYQQDVAEAVDNVLYEERFAIYLLGAFAAAALLLATIGLFGLVSYTTSQRTRELGIRLALGSSPEHVLGVVMRQGMVLLGMGLGVGGIASIWLGRALASRIVGVVSFDPAVFGAIFALLGVAGALASLVPAIRAVRIPPAVALRYE